MRPGPDGARLYKFAARMAGCLVLAAAMNPFAADAADPSYRNSAEVRQAMQALRTEDPAELRLRWGSMADVASRGKLLGTPQGAGGFWDGGAFWREARWLVPGAVMLYGVGHCRKGKDCQRLDWLVQYNAQESRLDYFTTNDLAYMRGQLQPDGAVKVTRGFITYENVRLDSRTDEIVVTDWVAMPVRFRRATATQLIAASAGHAGDPAEAAAEERAQAQARAERERLVAEELARTQAAHQAARQQAEREIEDQRLAGEAALAQARAEAQARADAQAAERQRAHAALRERFPALGPEAPQVKMFRSDPKGGLQPDIFVVQVESPGSYAIEAVADGFSPYVAVYRIGSDSPLATAAGTSGELVQSSMTVEAGANYVVVVQSADGRSGHYALRLKD